MTTKENKKTKKIPYNVLDSSVGKAVVASTLITGLGVTGTYDLILPGFENLEAEAATITPEFSKLFGSTGMFQLSNMIVGTDGYIYATGMSNAAVNGYVTNAGWTDSQIWKFDQMGNLIWVKNFGGTGGEYGLDILELDASTVVLVAQSDVNSDIPLSGETDVSTTKSVAAFIAYDKNGNKKWIKTYNKGTSSGLSSIEKTTGGYFASVNYSRNGDTFHELIKYDNNLNVLWTKPLTTAQYAEVDMNTTSDNGAVVVSTSGDWATRNYTNVFQKYNSSGTVVSSKTIPLDSAVTEIIAVSDGYIGVGSHRDWMTNKAYFYLHKFDANFNKTGTIDISSLVGNSGYIQGLKVHSDGTVIINGATTSSDYGLTNSNSANLIFKVNTSLGIIWTKVFDDTPLSDVATAFVPISTNDFMMGSGTRDSGIRLIRFKDTPPDNASLVSSIATPTNKDVDVTINYPVDAVVKQYKLGAGGNWTNYTGAVKLTSNNTVFARSQDRSQNWSAETSLAVTNIDKTPPASATLTASTTAETNSDVSVTINYPGDASVKEYKIGASGTWTEYNNPVVLNANNTVYARSKDAVGNLSSETSLIVNNIDKTAPITPTLEASNGSATNGDVSVNITYPADATTKQYRINGGVWINYSGPITVSENSKVEAQGIDAAGNVSSIGMLDIANIDKDAPVITLTPTKTAPTNVAIDVDIDIVDNNPIVEKKWAEGNQGVAFFDTGGTDVIGDTFNVSQNGTYTVYAKDSAGNTTIKTITVSNIDMESPTMTLTPTKTAPTNVAIDVDVELVDNNAIVEKKWAKGSQDADYFTFGGTDIIGDAFNVSENGIYTVFAKDSAGNTTIQTIAINNIDMEPPTITLTPSTLDATNAQIDVDVQAFDNKEIVELKWAEGNQPISYFANAGTEVVDNKIIVSENGMYTVYAKDSAGNESVQTLTVTNLDFEAPVITLTPETVDPINTAIHVDVLVIDGNPIVEKKWAKGTQDIAYFATNGTTLVGDQFLVSENDVYTVYAKDSAGNESLEFITVANLDYDKPDTPTFTVDNTAPTNSNVNVTISYPADASLQEVKIGASGTWQTYTSPVSISENTTVFARAKDAAGNYSAESSLNITNIDTTAPVVEISGIVNGETYVNEATPTYTATDLNDVTVEVLLNGEVFTDGPVKESGSYIFTVKATDSAGNVTLETVAFHVNHTPKITGTIDNKAWNKFTKETIDLSTLFTDTENDKLTYTVTTSEPNVISAVNTNGILELEALKQGNATITIIANDKYSGSETISFDVVVESMAPVVAFSNEQTKIVAKDESVTIEGTVKDEDKEDVTVTVSLNGVSKSVVISTTGEEDKWSIEFLRDELAAGVYTITVKAEDPYSSSVDLQSNNHVVKLPGTLEEFEPTLSGYEKDISKDRLDFSIAEHSVLLDAYIAVEGLKSTNNPDAWLSVKPKVDALADGTVKEGFYRAINGNALDYLNDNFDTATKSDYETAGIENVQEVLVPKYNEKAADYLAEKGELSEADIQLIIDVVNAVDKATNSNNVDDWKTALELINQLEDGAVKEGLLQNVEDGLIKSIEVNPSVLTKDLLGNYLDISIHAELEADYQLYLADVLAVEGALTKVLLQTVIDTVDGVNNVITTFNTSPTQVNLTAFEKIVEELVDGTYQTKNEAKLPTLNLTMVVHDPSAMTEAALDTIGVTYNATHMSLYKDFLTAYLLDVSKENVTKEALQLIINVVDSVEEVKANPTDENIQKVNDLLDGLDSNAKIVTDTKTDVNGSIVESINKDFTTVTEKQLENIGIEEVVSERLPDYQNALDEYAKEHDPKDLTLEDIQEVIDAINGVEDAKVNPSAETITTGYDAVNKLDDGPLKDKLLKELEDITIEYIANNPDSITNELLEQANLDTNPDLFESYKEYLQDVLPNLPKPVSKEQLQELIDAVNEVWAAYHKAMKQPSKDNVLSYEGLVDALNDGVFKTNMTALVDDVALAFLIVSPTTQEADDYARMGVTINEENITAYNTNMSKYIQDIGAGNFSSVEVNLVVAVTDKVETALVDSSTTNVNQALQSVRNLVAGTLKADLSAALNGEVMGDINLDPSKVTPDDLINLGIDNVNPDLEKEYQDALEKLKEDLGGTLTFDDVQEAIDAVNAVDKAIENGNTEDIQNAIDAINKLPEGSLKDDLLNQIKDIVVEDVLNKPSDLTADKLIIGGFDEVDSTLEDTYKEHLGDYIDPLTKENVQQVIDIVNQVKKTRLDLTLEDRNKLSDMVSKLADSLMKENITKVYNALNQLYSTEQSFNQSNVRDSFELIELVTSSERAYLEQMAKSFAEVLTTIVTPSDETVALAQAELVKLEDGQLKNRFQERVGGAYLEHVITTPGSSQHSDWVNAGFEDVIEEDFPTYKGAVGNITDEVGQLTKEQIQAVIDAINAMNDAKKKPSNSTIQTAKDMINKVVNSTWKTEAIAEMDALWKSIQPKPTPPEEVKPAPVVPKPEVVLPKPSEKVMVVENEHAAILMEIPTIEVSESSELKVKIKIHAKDLLEGSKLYIYANSANARGLGAATLANQKPGVQLIGANGKIVEIDFGKMDKGTIEVDRNLVFGEDGEYLLKGVFVANGTNLETNTVKVSVFKELLIPNTVLPNPHGLPVATMKANQDIALYKLDKDGNFIRSGTAKKGTLHSVYDTQKGFYQLADGLYVQPSKAITVHIGKGEVRKDKVNVYDKNGRFLRTITKGQEYKVYAYDDKRYNIGGGEYIQVQDGVTYVFGWMTINKPMTLYKSDGTAERTLNKGEKYRIYRADAEYLHLGGGYKVKRDLSKFTFLKN